MCGTTQSGEPENPIWRHYAEIAFWLVPHHVVGRVYVIGALVLAPLGAYAQYLAESSGAPREFTTLAVVDAVMLMTTTVVPGAVDGIR